MAVNRYNNYKDVSEEVLKAETDTDIRFKNQSKTRCQYEWVLYKMVSDLFESVRCRSMGMEGLSLYFSELPHRKKDGADSGKRTQESVASEMKALINKEVVGNVPFPMIQVCAAESLRITEEDGSHTFVFTDGIYGFSVHLDMTRSGHPKGITVEDLMKDKPVREEPDNKAVEDHAAVCAA